MKNLTNLISGITSASRRPNLISRTAMLSMALLLSPMARAKAAEPPSNPFFAMDTAVRSLDRLDAVKDLGYAGISWIPGPPDELAAAVQQLRQRELRLFAVYAGATLTKTGLTWSSQLEADIAVLKGTGAIIWLPISSKDFPSSSPEGDDLAAADLSRLADLAEAHGVRVALYPHLGTWVERVQDAIRVTKKVGRKNLGVTFNLCHCLMVGDEARISELLEQAAPHLFLVTINGADAGAGRTSWGRLIRPLDEGTYDTRIVLNKLIALHYQGAIGLQGFGVSLAVEDNLRRSMTAWKKLKKIQP